MLEETAQEWWKQAEPSMLEEIVKEWMQGYKEGREEARREGELKGMREFIVLVITTRFGRLPDRMRRRIKEISSKQELRKLCRKAQVATSLQQLGF